MFSDESQVIEWYAKGVGLVKHEESSRKLGQKMTKIIDKNRKLAFRVRRLNKKSDTVF